MEVKIKMRCENTQEGNTWYSDAIEGAGEVQIHMPRELYLAMGQLKYIEVVIRPDKEQV